jgi:hypothetical protein
MPAVAVDRDGLVAFSEGPRCRVERRLGYLAEHYVLADADEILDVLVLEEIEDLRTCETTVEPDPDHRERRRFAHGRDQATQDADGADFGMCGPWPQHLGCKVLFGLVV